MKSKIVCEDKYEAQKLASLIYIKDTGEVNIAAILNAVENEIVIELRDRSVHSILFKDKSQAETFADFIQSVTDGVHKVITVVTRGEKVEFEKA